MDCKEEQINDWTEASDDRNQEIRDEWELWEL